MKLRVLFFGGELILIKMDVRAIACPLIVMGAGIMLISILKIKTILLLFEDEQDRKQWKILYFLMIFFLLGYSGATYLVLAEMYFFIAILTGVVFFFGSCFVLLSVRIYYHSLFVKQRQYRQAKENAEFNLRKLKKMQMQLVQNEKVIGLGRLVAGIAHEINNPISFIHGNLIHVEEYTNNLFALIHLYRDRYSRSDPKINNFVRQIDLDYLETDMPRILNSMQKGTNRIRDLVKSFRNFSRLDEAKFKMVSLQEGLESTLNILDSYLKTKENLPKIEIIANYGTLPPVECNPREINQVFLNVLINASDAIAQKQKNSSDREPGKISIDTETIDRDWVRIIIADNGIGIDEEIRDRIFDPFFTTKPPGQGMGLGLSICYQIVNLKHKGNLKYHSTPQQGTKFIIELPTK